MNFVAYDATYSIYSQATFKHRVNLAFKTSTDADKSALAKYERRGWVTLSNVRPTGNIWFIDVKHHVGDSMTWTIPLDTTCISLRHRLSPSSLIFKWDPVRYNTWSLSSMASSGRVRPLFLIVRSAVLRYAYLAANESTFNTLKHRTDKFRNVLWKDSQRKKLTLRRSTWTW